MLLVTVRGCNNIDLRDAKIAGGKLLLDAMVLIIPVPGETLCLKAAPIGNPLAADSPSTLQSQSLIKFTSQVLVEVG